MDEIRPPKPIVEFDEFAKLDLRVARVLECREHPNADKLLIVKVDLGIEQRRIPHDARRGVARADPLRGRRAHQEPHGRTFPGRGRGRGQRGGIAPFRPGCCALRPTPATPK